MNNMVNGHIFRELRAAVLETTVQPIKLELALERALSCIEKNLQQHNQKFLTIIADELFTQAFVQRLRTIDNIAVKYLMLEIMIVSLKACCFPKSSFGQQQQKEVLYIWNTHSWNEKLLGKVLIESLMSFHSSKSDYVTLASHSDIRGSAEYLHDIIRGAAADILAMLLSADLARSGSSIRVNFAETLLTETNVIWGLLWLQKSKISCVAASSLAALDCLLDIASKTAGGVSHSSPIIRTSTEESKKWLADLWEQRAWLKTVDVLFTAPLCNNGCEQISRSDSRPCHRVVFQNQPAVTVLEREGLRRMVFEPWRPNGPMFVQSERQPSAGAKELTAWYTRAFLGLLALCCDDNGWPKDGQGLTVLSLGLGGGVVPSAMHAWLPDVRIQEALMPALY